MTDNLVFSFTFSGIVLVIGTILIGVLVGALCRLGAKEPANISFGVVAVVLAVVLICLGRIVWNAPTVSTAQNTVALSDDAMILTLAEGIAWQTKMEGVEIAWPEGVTPESASKKDDYPLQIWQTATQQWSYYTPQQKEAARKKGSGEAIAVQTRSPGILERIGLWGGCCSVFAGILAFVIGGRFIG